MEHIELIAFISGGAIAVAFALVLSLQRGLRAEVEALARRIESSEAEMARLHRGAAEARDEASSAQQRARELAEQITLLARQQEQMLLRDPEGGPYMQAVRAAGSGASVDVLMSTYGLSRSEAELVVTLHRPPQDSDA